MNDKRDGSYLIAFTPDVAGLMSLSIKVQNKDIKGSPFLINIRTLRPHSGIFHCCTFCSSKGSKIMTCACNSKMPSYKGMFLFIPRVFNTEIVDSLILIQTIFQDAVMVTMAIQARGIGRAAQVYWSLLNALQPIHFAHRRRKIKNHDDDFRSYT